MHRLRLFVLVLALALVLPLLASPLRAAQAPTTPDMAAIDRYVEEQLRTLRVPGASLGIVHGDRIVHLRGFGRADSAGRAMTVQTPSVIGSLTKSFTAVAIMQLAEQGKLDLDAPVQRYIPWFRVADADAAARITVRHLLTHSSGLPGGDAAVMLREDTAADAIERQVRALATVQLAHPVGSTSEYANDGYITLGLIVEKLSGRSYEEYVRQHIFAPLGMEQSFTSPHVARRFGLAEGHQYWFGQPRQARLPYPRGLLPTGFLVSSAEDMSRYLLAHLNGGRVGDARILSPEGIAELHRPGITIDDQGVWAGMGWGVIDADGVRVLQHDGKTGSYRSDMYLLPETGWGFVLLMNGDYQLQRSASGVLGRGVATLLMGQEPQPVALNAQASFLPWVLLAIAALQLLGMARSIRTLRRWRASLPARAVWRQIVLPLAGNALVALLFLVVLPATILPLPLAMLVRMTPNVGYTLVIGGGVALGWSLVRTVLALRLTRRPVAARRSALVHA